MMRAPAQFRGQAALISALVRYRKLHYDCLCAWDRWRGRTRLVDKLVRLAATRHDFAESIPLVMSVFHFGLGMDALFAGIRRELDPDLEHTGGARMLDAYPGQVLDRLRTSLKGLRPDNPFIDPFG